MGQRAMRTVAFVVALALLSPACGGSGDGGSSAISPAGSDAETSESVAPADFPALLDGGVVSDAALASALTADGQPDAAALRAFVAEFSALPVEQQETVVAELSSRTELEAAAISGLEAAVGDRAATEAALTGAGSQIQAQIDAAVASVVEVAPDGLRHGLVSRQVAAPSSGTVAAIGLFLGYMAISTFARAGLEGSNKLAAGEDSYHEGDGKVMGASLEEVGMELKYKGDERGVAVEFVASTAIHPCPAPDGSFTIEATVDIKASKDGAGQNAIMELKIDGTVDDNAEIASKNIENHTQWADYGGGKGQFVDFTMSGHDGVEQIAHNRTGGTVTDEFAKTSAVLSTLFGILISSQLLDATEAAWKSGRCVELKVTPSAGPDRLPPSTIVSVLAEPRSRVDGSSTGGNVTATLTAGEGSVDPNGAPVPADATSTYTAPGEDEKSGTVSYEARSRRGIGKAEITFSTPFPAAYLVQGGLQDWQVNQMVCDIMQPFTLESPGVGTAEFSGGLSGDYSVTGVFNLQYTGTYEIHVPNGLGSHGTMTATSGGSIAEQGGSGTENYTLIPAVPCEPTHG